MEEPRSTESQTHRGQDKLNCYQPFWKPAEAPESKHLYVSIKKIIAVTVRACPPGGTFCSSKRDTLQRSATAGGENKKLFSEHTSCDLALRLRRHRRVGGWESPPLNNSSPSVGPQGGSYPRGSEGKLQEELLVRPTAENSLPAGSGREGQGSRAQQPVPSCSLGGLYPPFAPFLRSTLSIYSSRADGPAGISTAPAMTRGWMAFTSQLVSAAQPR